MSQCQLDGFLLTRQWQDRKHLNLYFWVNTDQGPLRVEITDQEAVLFVASKQIDKTCSILSASLGKAKSQDYALGLWRVKEVGLKNFSHELMHAVYFSKQRMLYRARDELRQHGVTPFEADVSPTDRFLMERFITGSLSVQGELVKETSYLRMINPKIKPMPILVLDAFASAAGKREGRVETNSLSETRVASAAPNIPANFSPSYTVLSLDIETSMKGEQLYSIGLLAARASKTQVGFEGRQDQLSQSNEETQAHVFMIGPVDDAPSPAHPEYLVYCKDERALMDAFLDCYKTIDPDIIIGWAVINFDLRFLQRKADQLGMRLAMGRADSLLDWRQSRTNDEHYTLTMPGRSVLDGIDTLKSATYSFESFSLQNVSNEVLKRGKLIHNVDNRGEEITEQFINDKVSLAAYNLEDCQLVWDIFKATQLFDFAIERAQLTGLAMDRFGGSVAAFDNRYLPRLHRAGFIAPNLQEEPEGIGSPGGYVMSSKPGMYDHVLVLDFKSLYPSIISTFKIDPLGLILGAELCPLSLEKNQQETPLPSLTSKGEDVLKSVVSGFNGAVFSKEENILPDIIDELWAARDEAKRQNNKAMSQAIKILMNSFYGVLGTPGCRFFDSRLPSSITLRGHDILTKSQAFIESKGYNVIYGDTDSVFVWLEGQSKDLPVDQVHEQGRRLAKELNIWWAEAIEKEHHLESHLEIEFETHFKRFIMPTIRGSDKGSKKRYAGLVESVTDKGSELELVFKGLETVRTDWTLVAREFQRELYRRVFFNEPWENYIIDIVAEIYAGKRDEQLVYRKRLRRRLSDYQRNVPPHVRAARIADEQKAADGKPLAYQRGGWIRYVMTLNGPEPAEYIRTALDYDLYIERQIAPIADGILQFLGSSFSKVADKQMGMF